MKIADINSLEAATSVSLWRPDPNGHGTFAVLTPVGIIPLAGARGEPVDFARTIVSHGVAELPPNDIDIAGRTLTTTLPVAGGARTVRITSADGELRIDLVSGRSGAAVRAAIERTIAHMFRLDEDPSGFYELVGVDEELGWCANGAGRMLRAPTVFEDVVKTKRTLIRTLARTGEPYAARLTGASASAHPQARARRAPVAARPSAQSLGGGRSERC